MLFTDSFHYISYYSWIQPTIFHVVHGFNPLFTMFKTYFQTRMIHLHLEIVFVISSSSWQLVVEDTSLSKMAPLVALASTNGILQNNL